MVGLDRVGLCLGLERTQSIACLGKNTVAARVEQNHQPLNLTPETRDRGIRENQAAKVGSHQGLAAACSPGFESETETNKLESAVEG